MTLRLAILLFPALVFGQTPSAITLSTSPNPASYGQAVTLTATVTPGATGQVTFYDGTTVLAVGTISGGQVTRSTVLLPAGNRSLRAYYGGNATYSSSSSTLLPQTIATGASLGAKQPVALAPTAPGNIMAAGDFNGDGKQDVVGVSGSAVGLMVYIGNGDGTFQNGLFTSTAATPASMALGDFNGDNRLDLAMVSRTAVVTVFLGIGDGTFQAATTYPAGVTASGVALGDFNGDGRVDLAVGNANTAVMSILLGHGDGTFGSAVNYPAGGTTYSLAVGDFNGDGKADVAIGTSSGVSVLPGAGDGTLGTALYFPLSQVATSVVTADFNGDGKADLAVACYTGVHILPGNGDGTFDEPVVYSSFPANGLAVTDLDGDGKLDLVTVAIDSALKVLLGKGDGTFQPAATYGAASYPYTVVASEFTGDGKVDVIVASRYSSGLAFLAGGAIPDLTIAATHLGGFTQGQAGATYTITVTNTGDVSSSGPIGVVVSLPSGFTPTNLGGNGWTCVLANLTCARSDSLSPGASYTMTLKFNVSGGVTGIVNAAFVVSGGGEQNVANNYVSDAVFIRFATSTNLVSAVNPALLGAEVTLTSAVTVGATGTVTFYDGNTYLGAATIPAVLHTRLLPSGVRSLRAVYSGDSQYGPSASPLLLQTVTTSGANRLLPVRSFPTFPGVVWIGLGDFDGNGKADLITASNANVSVLPGNGDGTFAAAKSRSISNNPTRGVVGDFNRDGKSDVALAGTAGISLLLGNGDGTFPPPNVLGSGYYPFISSGDVNGDGAPDIVAIHSGSLVVFAGAGDGTFLPPLNVTEGTNFIFAALVDMNLDGKLDLVCGNDSYQGAVSVFLGNGDASFQPPLVGASVASYPTAFAVGDFNRDGKPDVAVTYFVGWSVQLGNGDGTLQPSLTSTLGAVPGIFALAGDFDGDGKLDLAYSAHTDDRVYLAFGTGGGALQSGTTPPVYVVGGSHSVSLVQADFNDDGRPDLAVGNWSAGAADVYLGGQFTGLNLAVAHTGNFTVGQTGRYRLTVTNQTFTSATGDVTIAINLPAGLTATVIAGTGWTCTLSTLSCTRNDSLGFGASYPVVTVTVSVAGNLSVATLATRATVSNAGIVNTAIDPTLIVLPTSTTLTASPNPSILGQPVTLTATVQNGNTGSVLFSDAGTILGSAVVIGGQAVWSTRLIPAGRRILTATYSGDSTRSVSTSPELIQTVNASLASGFAASVNYPTGVNPVAMTSGDFNLDGKLDLVTANSDGNSVSVLLGNGNGTFGASSDYATGIRPFGVITADFNNDGKPDLAVANQSDKTASILLGNGDGTFLPAVAYPAGAGAAYLAAGDFDGDAKVDLVVGNTTAGTLSLLLGKGDGTFSAGAEMVNANQVNGLATGDFNRDGKTDIAVSVFGVYVFLGNGDGTFQPSSYSFASSDVPTRVVDLDGDGNPDLVGAVSSYGVIVALGNGDGSFRAAVSYSNSNNLRSILSADVNGDGKIDIVVANATTNTIGAMFGNGDGTLQSPIWYAVGSSPQALAAGDFNGDGRTDLAATNTQSNNVSILLGVLTPVFSITSSHTGVFGLNQTGAVYTINVTNNGPGSTSGAVTVTDTLPAGFTATAISGAGWTCTLNSLACTRSDALSAGSAYPAISVTVNVSLNAGATVINQVSVSGGGGVSTGNIDPTTVAPASLRITKNHNGNFAPGQNGAVYTLSVSNQAGSGPTGGIVTVTETVPAGLSLVSMSGTGWTCPGTVVNSCTRSDSLGPGASYPTLTVMANVVAGSPTQVTNQVSVSGGSSATATASDLTVIDAPGLSVSVTHRGNLSQGQKAVVYSLTVSNAASASTTGAVSVTEYPPAGFTLVSMSGTGWSCPTLPTCTRNDSLPPGSSFPPLFAVLDVAANAGSPLINQAVVSGGAAANSGGFDSATILAAFGDAGSSDFFFNAVNLMRQYGITGGCSASPPLYCPNDNVTRAQMAIFVVRSVVGGDDFNYSATPHFNDVPTNTFGFQWIQKMFELGITAGCGNNNYCPNDPVTRGQMAVFVVRARLGVAADTTFTYPSTPSFTDVDAVHPYFRWIQRMKMDSITGGCGNGSIYCPDDAVTRGQMAIFIMRGGFNQLLPNGTPVLSSIAPASASAGQTTTVTIAGTNTHFALGTTQVNAGAGVTVGTITVISPISLNAQIMVAANASPGPRTIVVTSGAEQAVLPNGLTIP